MIINQRTSTYMVVIFSLIISFAFTACKAEQVNETPKPAVTVKKDLLTVKGKVIGFANPQQSKTISVDVKKKGVMVFKYTDSTAFKNFKYLNELTGEAAFVEYRTAGPDMIAASIAKALVKLPAGVTEIKTSEVANLVKKGPEAGNYFLVDSRPSKRYAEGHIPTALSLPVPKLEKEGASLLPPDKDILLIFYCGGPT